MNKLDRLNDWCGEFMNKLIRYDDLITFFTFAILISSAIVCVIIGILGLLGFIK